MNIYEKTLMNPNSKPDSNFINEATENLIEEIGYIEWKYNVNLTKYRLDINNITEKWKSMNLSDIAYYLSSFYNDICKEYELRE